MRCSAVSFASDTEDDYGSQQKAYSDFIDTLLFYQRIFEYSGDILSLMDLPYNIYHDLIVRQVQFKKKQKSAEDAVRAKQGKRR